MEKRCAAPAAHIWNLCKRQKWDYYKKKNQTKRLTARPTSRFNTQAPRDGQQVAALHERLQEKQRLLPGVQLLRLLQPVPPGGGLVDPVGTDRQWVGRCAQEEGEAAQGGAHVMWFRDFKQMPAG